jgi:fatty-acyl-CoA synthase
MLQRIMALPRDTRDAYDLGRVRVVAVSGSALPGDLGTEWMDQFGDHLYNVYGSTEVAYATIASPADLRASPGTAGRPPFGTVVRILDEHGRPLPRGRSGRIFVANSTLFEGYTGAGGSKDVVDGLMATGDVGRFDDDGRLVVEGRDDDMIVSGGENVFPSEVEDCLVRHEGVADAAALGVEDEDYGMRLRAFVVRTPGSDVSEQELKDLVRTSLARYKVPREIVFVEELPRNATGKVLKRELAEWA